MAVQVLNLDRRPNEIVEGLQSLAGSLTAIGNRAEEDRRQKIREDLAERGIELREGQLDLSKESLKATKEAQAALNKIREDTLKLDQNKLTFAQFEKSNASNIALVRDSITRKTKELDALEPLDPRRETLRSEIVGLDSQLKSLVGERAPLDLNVAPSSVQPAFQGPFETPPVTQIQPTPEAPIPLRSSLGLPTPSAAAPAPVPTAAIGAAPGQSVPAIPSQQQLPFNLDQAEQAIALAGAGGVPGQPVALGATPQSLGFDPNAQALQQPQAPGQALDLSQITPEVQRFMDAVPGSTLEEATQASLIFDQAEAISPSASDAERLNRFQRIQSNLLSHVQDRRDQEGRVGQLLVRDLNADFQAGVQALRDPQLSQERKLSLIDLMKGQAQTMSQLLPTLGESMLAKVEAESQALVAEKASDVEGSVGDKGLGEGVTSFALDEQGNLKTVSEEGKPVLPHLSNREKFQLNKILTLIQNNNSTKTSGPASAGTFKSPSGEPNETFLGLPGSREERGSLVIGDAIKARTFNAINAVRSMIPVAKDEDARKLKSAIGEMEDLIEGDVIGTGVNNNLIGLSKTINKIKQLTGIDLLATGIEGRSLPAATLAQLESDPQGLKAAIEAFEEGLDDPLESIRFIDSPIIGFREPRKVLGLDLSAAPQQ